MKPDSGQINDKKGGFKSAPAGFCAIVKKLRNAPLAVLAGVLANFAGTGKKAIAAVLEIKTLSNVPYGLIVKKLRNVPYVLLLLCFIALCPLAGVGAEKTAPAATVKTDMEAVKKDLKDNDHKKRREALETLSKTKNPEKLSLLEQSMNDSDPIIREKAARLIGKSKDASAFKTLSAALAGADRDTRLGAMEGLGDLGDKKAVKPLAALLTHKDRNTRWKAAEVLGRLKVDESVDALLKAAIEDKDEYVKKAAVMSLGKIGTKKAAAALAVLKAGGNEKLASWAGNVLKTTGK